MIAGTRYRLTQMVAQQTRLSQDIARAQTEISTQTRIQAPSDDPLAASRIAQLTRAAADETRWAANADAAISLNDRVETNLTSLGDLMDRAKTLMLQASNDTLSASDRSAIATELRGLASDVTGLGDASDSRGQKLFADDAALSYPVGAAITVRAGGVKAGIFTGLATAGGAKDLTAILTDAAAAIETTDADARATATAASLAEVDVGVAGVTDARAELGVRSDRLASIKERFAETRRVNAEERSSLEDIDINETVIRLQAKMTALSAAQALLAKTTSKGLLDYI